MALERDGPTRVRFGVLPSLLGLGEEIHTPRSPGSRPELDAAVSFGGLEDSRFIGGHMLKRTRMDSSHIIPSGARAGAPAESSGPRGTCSASLSRGSSRTRPFSRLKHVVRAPLFTIVGRFGGCVASRGVERRETGDILWVRGGEKHAGASADIAADRLHSREATCWARGGHPSEPDRDAGRSH